MKTNLKSLKAKIETELRRLSDKQERKKELSRLQEMFDAQLEKWTVVLRESRAGQKFASASTESKPASKSKTSAKSAGRVKAKTSVKAAKPSSKSTEKSAPKTTAKAAAPRSTSKKR